MSRPGPGETLVSVAVPIPARRTFTYAVPASLAGSVSPGRRVRVPFGSRKLLGTVVDEGVEAPEGVEVREISGVVETGPSLEPEILDLCRFVSDYYLCSLGDAIETALPPDPGPGPTRRMVRRLPGSDPEDQPTRAVARRRILQALPAGGEPVPVGALPARDRRLLPELETLGLVERFEAADRSDREKTGAPHGPPERGHDPSPAQRAVLEPLLGALDAGVYAPFLLHGVTGSGKTEVYLQAAERTLESGRGVLYLVPEIGLTPLLMTRLRRRFGDAVEVLHSALSARQRYRAWERVRTGDCRFVVGTRSAVFAPVRRPGLVVVDEEHDGSYKQEETPRYNGRDLAVYRARESGAVVVLGSATPSLESYQHASAGRYSLLNLPERVHRKELPGVSIVDMRAEFKREGEIRPLSATLLAALRGCLERGEQALILRNRRGWSVVVFCPSCGNSLRCDRCSLALTWHRKVDRLRCHGCDREIPTRHRCPTCGEEELRFLGEGAERVEDELVRALPGARIVRMDRDAVRRKGMHEAILRRFENREIDVLVGTQMIAKGHDFPGVTVVGVLSSDQSLGLPDFRAAERTFQLLTQVAGRSGRGEEPGQVILQAFDPDHPVLRLAVRHDFESFFRKEIEYRRALRYPPFAAVVRILVRDRDPGKASSWAWQAAEAIRREGAGRLMVSGPGPAPVERLKDLYRQQVLVRSAGRRRLVESVDRAVESLEGEVPRKALLVDVDPYSLL